MDNGLGGICFLGSRASPFPRSGNLPERAPSSRRVLPDRMGCGSPPGTPYPVFRGSVLPSRSRGCFFGDLFSPPRTACRGVRIFLARLASLFSIWRVRRDRNVRLHRCNGGPGGGGGAGCPVEAYGSIRGDPSPETDRRGQIARFSARASRETRHGRVRRISGGGELSRKTRGGTGGGNPKSTGRDSSDFRG